MKKLTKIAAISFFALFLSACDQKSETNATANSRVSTLEQGIADYKALSDWNQAQGQKLADAQLALQQKVLAQDSSQIQQALAVFESTTASLLNELSNLKLQNPEVIAVRTKINEALSLHKDLVISYVTKPSLSDEEKAAIQKKEQQSQQVNQELQVLQAKLQEKFGAK